MSLLPSTHNNALTTLRGFASFSPKNPDGSYQAEILLSPSSEMTLTQAGETLDYLSQEEGLAENLKTIQLSLSRTIALTCNRMAAETKALFFVADNSTVIDAGDTVVGEVSDYIVPGRVLQLGGTINGGGGAWNVSALTATIEEGSSAAAWVADSAYAFGTFVKPTISNDHFYLAIAVAGVADSGEPTWPTDGGTVVDGGVTWQDMGLIAVANASNSAFELEATYARVNLLSTGQLAAAYAKLPASIRAAGTGLRLRTSYTRAAATFNQLATKENANVEGRFTFIERNPDGENSKWFCPSVNLAPTGDYAAKSGNAVGAIGFTISVLKPPAGPAMIQNGVPVAIV